MVILELITIITEKFYFKNFRNSLSLDIVN